MKKSGQSKMKVQLYEGLLVVVIIVVIVVLILAVRSDKKNIEKTFDNTLTYLKSQCLSYDEVVQADKIKSLVRLTEQAVEVGADIHRDSELIDSVYLKNYTEAQRMAGIIILDEDMQPECQYSNVGLDYDAWKELLQLIAVGTGVHIDRTAHRTGDAAGKFQTRHITLPVLTATYCWAII